MISGDQISYLKSLKVKNITIIDNKTILGDNDDGGVFKVLYITNDNINLDLFDNGIDLNAYKNSIKDGNIDNLNLWSSQYIKSEHIRKLNRIETLKGASSETKYKELNKEENHIFYNIMNNYKSKDNGEFVDIFKDNNYLFIYPAILKLTKNDLVSVTRYSIANNKLYKFSLKNKNFILDTYVLCIDV